MEEIKIVTYGPGDVFEVSYSSNGSSKHMIVDKDDGWTIMDLSCGYTQFGKPNEYAKDIRSSGRLVTDQKVNEKFGRGTVKYLGNIKDLIKTKIEIVVAKHGEGVKAYLKSNYKIWEAGENENTAIGKLIVSLLGKDQIFIERA